MGCVLDSDTDQVPDFGTGSVADSDRGLSGHLGVHENQGCTVAGVVAAGCFSGDRKGWRDKDSVHTDLDFRTGQTWGPVF